MTYIYIYTHDVLQHWTCPPRSVLVMPDVKWVCLKIVYPEKPNGFADHYPYIKWLFHWEYTPFSDIPKCPLSSNHQICGCRERFFERDRSIGSPLRGPKNSSQDWQVNTTRMKTRKKSWGTSTVEPYYDCFYRILFLFLMVGRKA